MITSGDAELPHKPDQVTGPGRSRIVIGAGVPRLTLEQLAVENDTKEKALDHLGVKPQPAPEDRQENLTEEPQHTVIPTRADGTDYDEPESKNIGEHPLHQINIEVDDEGNAVAADGPIVVDQFINPAWKRTWTQGPPVTTIFDLGNPSDLTQWNAMQAEAEPPTAPRTFILKAQEQFDEKTGSWKLYVVSRKITYKKILRIT